MQNKNFLAFCELFFPIYDKVKCQVVNPSFLERPLPKRQPPLSKSTFDNPPKDRGLETMGVYRWIAVWRKCYDGSRLYKTRFLNMLIEF